MSLRDKGSIKKVLKPESLDSNSSSTWVEESWESRTSVLGRSEWTTPWLASWGWEPTERELWGRSGRADISQEARCELHDPAPASAKKTLCPDFDSENLGKNWVGKREFSKLGGKKKRP